MIEMIDAHKLKRRFGKLLSNAYHLCHISLEAMNAKLLLSNFDFFEGGSTEEFMNSNLEDIVFKIFDCRYLDEEKEDMGPLYWAGIQYMNIFLNLGVPLKRALLCCPLSTMVDLYEPYHEMGESRLLERYLEIEKDNPVLRMFLRKNNLSVSSLSALTGIAETTLRYYAKDNEHLFSASYDSITKIKEALGADEVYFHRNTSFVPLTYALIEDGLFLEVLGDIVCDYFSIETKEHLKVSYEKDGEFCLVLGIPNRLVCQSKVKVIEDHELKLLLRFAVYKTAKTFNILSNGLLF
jgi:hypothetical protein